MHAVRAASQRDVRAVIHQNAASVRIGQRQNAAHEFRQFPRRKVFLANLDPLDALVQRPPDRIEQRVYSAERAAVGDVVSHSVS